MAYLGVTEPSGWVRVQSTPGPSGGEYHWRILFRFTRGGTIEYYYSEDGGDDNLTKTVHSLVYWYWWLGGAYGYQYNGSAEVIIKENSPHRVVLYTRCDNLGNTAGERMEVEITIYPTGYLFHKTTFINNTGAIKVMDGSSLAVRYNQNAIVPNINIADGNNTPNPTANEFWFGVHSNGAFDSIIAYKIDYNGQGAHNKYFESTDNIQYYLDTVDDMADGDLFNQIYALYIGGKSITPETIEADGVFLLDWNLA